tara:strand:+ start:1960 stop:2181 length:222 start_codon:yes stop_codon:yes gene_type:complete
LEPEALLVALVDPLVESADSQNSGLPHIQHFHQPPIMLAVVAQAEAVTPLAQMRLCLMHPQKAAVAAEQAQRA